MKPEDSSEEGGEGILDLPASLPLTVPREIL